MANEFVAKNGLISQNNSTVTGSLTVTGNATVVNAFIGTIAAFGSNYMAFSHTSRATTNDYSLLSDNAGITYLNAKAGSSLNFRIDNIDKAILDSTGNLTIGKTTAANAVLDVNGNTVITGSLNVTAGVIGALQGTASWATNALTASTVLGMGSYNVTQSFTNASTWTFNHNLGYKTVVIQAYNSADAQIIPQSIVLSNTNTATLTFPVNVTGYAVATVGGALALSTASYTQTAVSSSYATTASYANNADLLDGLNSTVFASTGSNTFTGTQLTKAGTSGFTHATTDYAAGTTGTILYTTLGAATGNVYGSISVRTSGGSSAASDLILNPNGSTRVAIGNKTSANATLDVNGNAIITGSLNVSSSISINGKQAVNGPTIRVNANTVTTSLPNSTLTVIKFDTVLWDSGSASGSNFNMTNANASINGYTVGPYSFSPSVAGYYQVAGHFSFGSMGASTGTIITTIYKNGSEYCRGTRTPCNVAGGSGDVNTVIYFNGAGDYINIQAIQSSGNTETTEASSAFGSWFTATMLRGA